MRPECESIKPLAVGGSAIAELIADTAASLRKPMDGRMSGKSN